jgi:hypothetical protein
MQNCCLKYVSQFNKTEQSRSKEIQTSLPGSVYKETHKTDTYHTVVCPYTVSCFCVYCIECFITQLTARMGPSPIRGNGIPLSGQQIPFSVTQNFVTMFT